MKFTKKVQIIGYGVMCAGVLAGNPYGALIVGIGATLVLLAIVESNRGG